MLRICNKQLMACVIDIIFQYLSLGYRAVVAPRIADDSFFLKVLWNCKSEGVKSDVNT